MTANSGDKKRVLLAHLAQAGLYGSLFGLKKLVPPSATKGDTIKRVLGTAAIGSIAFNGLRSIRVTKDYLAGKYGKSWETIEMPEKDAALRDLVTKSPQNVFTLPLITQLRAVLATEPLKKVAFGVAADKVKALRGGPIVITKAKDLGKALVNENTPQMIRRRAIMRALAKADGLTAADGDRFFSSHLAKIQQDVGSRTAGFVGKTLDGAPIFYNRSAVRAPSSLLNRREALAHLLIARNRPFIDRSLIASNVVAGAMGTRVKWKKPIRALGGIGAAAVNNPIRFMAEAGALITAGYGVKKLVDYLRNKYRERKNMDKTKNT